MLAGRNGFGVNRYLQVDSDIFGEDRGSDFQTVGFANNDIENTVRIRSDCLTIAGTRGVELGAAGIGIVKFKDNGGGRSNRIAR